MHTEQTRFANILPLLLVALTFLSGAASATRGPSDTSVPAGSARASTSQETPETADELVYVTKTGTKYHRTGCSYLSKSAIPIPLKEVGARYQPCSACAPPATTAGVPSPPARPPNTLTKPKADAATDAAQTVYVTRTGSKYHRAGCRYLAKSAIPISLADAATRYGPCSGCRPPSPSATAKTTTPATATSPPPAKGGRCAATTKAETRCKRNAKAGSRYCWQHGG